MRKRIRRNAESPAGRPLERILADPTYGLPWFIDAVSREPLWFTRPVNGSFEGIGWTRKSYAFAGLRFKEREVVWSRDDKDALRLDPDVSKFARVLVRGGWADAMTTTHEWSADRGWHYSPWLTVGEIDDLSREHVEVARSCDWVRGELPPLARFRYRSMEHVGGLVFYHATRKSAVRSIKRRGLLPSKTVRAGEGSWIVGWTQINFDLQDAVYLTASQDYAENVALSLSDNWGEPAVILSVKGSDLDVRSLNVDEDALRDNYSGDVSSYGCLGGMPAYFTSLLWGSHFSVAYLDKIDASRLTFEFQL